jgi:glycine dehydrogenase
MVRAVSLHKDLPEHLAPSDTFVHRHIGPTEAEVEAMLEVVGAASLAELADQAIPRGIRAGAPLILDGPRGEREVLAELADIAGQNQVYRSFIGTGYYDCIVPPVIQRNILENPGWYTQYTPYQAEIAQGRLEALVNFQTAVADLTGLPLANASLLDEATAAAEAMTMAAAIGKHKRSRFFVDHRCHPQTIEVVKTRAEPVGIDVEIGAPERIDFDRGELFAVLVQYPTTDGEVVDHSGLCERAHQAKTLVIMATDLLALTLLRSPGEIGADIAVGSTQRFGVPMGFGGPHAAFLSTHEEHRRQIPGRLVGVSRDVRGQVGYRLALQTREQHIRRDRATSNICTAQVLLAVMAGMYAVYHGPDGLERIARRVRGFATALAAGLEYLGLSRGGSELPEIFDTVRVDLDAEQREVVLAASSSRRINLRRYPDGLGASVDETTGPADVEDLLEVFAAASDREAPGLDKLVSSERPVAEAHRRGTEFLTHPVFHRYHSEHEMLRYVHRLQARDLSMTTSMIPLGSCTMKLNGTVEMLPITWPNIAGLHPFAPAEQTRGYEILCDQLASWLAEITGFAAVSLQPNAGAQGEYAGLLVIRAYHADRGQGHRDVCLIPTSAHGTNPASAVMAGYRVIAVACDDSGNIDVDDLAAKAQTHADKLAALMVTYPSTHGVFEERIREICQVVHDAGGQVYLDGANMNAQVGLCRPGDYGADVCHLNLHKTFCIPHGGGGPGMGPIAVAPQLVPYLPGHPERPGGARAIGPISAAPFGSAAILPISWVYIRLMGEAGLRRATEVAILNANYMAARLSEEFEILYRGQRKRVAHEFIVDVRPFKKTAGIEVDDIAKRLMDYGFHAPTMSFPVAGTLMIEPTESECRAELDRFCDALLAIRAEIREIEDGSMDRANNPLKNAPHTAADIAGDWDRPYSRERGAFPAPHTRVHKYWPPVGRVDNAWGDRNLMCQCPAVEDVAE